MPRFKYKGCSTNNVDCFKQYINDNLKIPSPDCNGIVFVKFVVGIHGKIENISIVKGLEDCSGYAEEIERILKSCPDWVPGKQRGKPVRVQFVLPFEFFATKINASRAN